ncbi:serine hydrolase domain-containing protein [Alcanivorax hongdengensis]|nr:serine hydrolase domain-containing protein [Alcanivorax hongdengensis]
MALRPRMRRIITRQGTRIPRSLDSLTRVGDEVSAERGGLGSEQVDAIWRATRSLYRGGMSPAISLCLRRHGEIVLNRSLGYADPQAGRIMTPDTPVCLFSASKVVTAMLVHHLVEQGQLDLDDPVTRYLPAYGQQGKERTTIRHLLTHQAGIPRPPEKVEPEILYRPQDILDLLCSAKPSGFNSQAYHAITAGFVLGAVVEAITGEDLNATLDRVIRQPMGMTYFTFGATGPERARDVSTGLPMKLVDLFLTYAVGGSIDEVVEVTNDDRFQDIIVPAGNLYATAEEASRFFQMLLNDGAYNGQQIFQPETVRRALEPAYHRPRIDRTLLLPLNFSSGFMLGNRGMGMFGPGAPKAFGHLGFISIYCWADPQRDLSGALLTTGKGVVGPHLPALFNLQYTINRHTRLRG